MICANCGADAVFQLADPGAEAVLYCRACLPVHLLTRADSGQMPLPLVVEPEPEPDPAPAPKKAAKK